MIKIDDDPILSPISVISNTSGMIDFEGKLSLTLWVQGCNLACGWCHNPVLIKQGSLKRIPYEEVKNTIKTYKESDWIDAVVISGGEPTLFSGLGKLCSMIKELNIAIKVDTNGTRPTTILELLDILDENDYIAIDYKIPIDDYIKHTDTMFGERVLVSIDALRKTNIPYEIRTTIIENVHTRGVFIEMMKNIKKDDLWILQSFNNQRVLHEKYLLEANTTKHYLQILEKIAKDVGYNVRIR